MNQVGANFMEISQANQPLPAKVEKRLKQAAQDLEANFLAEMLKSAGVGKTPKGLGGGGAGEDHFASFMRMEQAKQMAANGGIGLAETLFHSLKERMDD
jgi:Rod binding domain-containing protein